MRYILLLVISVFCIGPAQSAEIKSCNFNDSSFCGLVHGSYWSIQSNGGVDNSPYARLRYPDYGTANKNLQVSTSAYNTNTLWIEANVRAVGSPSGGSKFIKLFGDDPNGQTWNNTSNLTFALDYNTNTNQRVAYYVDTSCTAWWNGDNSGGDYYPECDAAVHHTTGPIIDIRGTTWHHYKAYVKRADYMQGNGEVKVWWNGVLVSHVTGMYSRVTQSNYFKYMEFGGYNHDNFNGTEWYLDVDNIYVGTTEKGTTPAPPDECDADHLWLCDTELKCTSEGFNWCDGVCQIADCPINPDPINGTCGTANGGTFEDLQPSSPNLCIDDAAVEFTKIPPTVTWTCPGYYGGASSYCTATITTDDPTDPPPVPDNITISLGSSTFILE